MIYLCLNFLIVPGKYLIAHYKNDAPPLIALTKTTKVFILRELLCCYLIFIKIVKVQLF